MSKTLAFVFFLIFNNDAAAFSISKGSESNRRSFLSTSIATVVGGTSVLLQPQQSRAATAKEIITTKSGIKYAITKEPTDKKPVAPYKGTTPPQFQRIERIFAYVVLTNNLNSSLSLSLSLPGDFVAIDYTGYLANGQVR